MVAAQDKPVPFGRRCAAAAVRGQCIRRGDPCGRPRGPHGRRLGPSAPARAPRLYGEVAAAGVGSDRPVANGATIWPRRWVPVSGITLVELLVVLALLGVLAAVALPNLERLTASVARDSQREHLLNQFAELGAAAMLDGFDYVVAGTDAPDDDVADALVGRTRYLLDVPDGWEVLIDEPILARANGVCLGGSVILLHEQLEPLRVELTAPFCRVDAS